MKYLYLFVLVVLSTALVTDRVRICEKYNRARCANKCSCCSMRLCESELGNCHCQPCKNSQVNNSIQQILKILPQTQKRMGIGVGL